MENAWIAMVPGISSQAIVTAAREGGFELVVVGFAGHTNLFGRVMGSTARTSAASRPATC